MPLPTGTVTFLFSDIEGSTQRWEAHREAMATAVARHDALMRAVCEKNSGFVFKTVGDAFCIAFSQPQAAIMTALDAQLALSAENFSSVDGLRVRMAIHTGIADERDGDFFGPAVNRVARLLAIGHGGQVLVSGTTCDLLEGLLPDQSSLRDLGSHMLRDLAHPEHVHQLVASGLPSTFLPLRSLNVLPNNLPRQPSSFIGREEELAELKGLLEKSQVVTIVGAGGVGKTRTALQLGADLLDGSGEGVWFVDMGQVAHADDVVPEIASALNLEAFSQVALLDQVRSYLKNKRLLLILDNCEHLVAEVSRAVVAIVTDCAKVSILATSREPLNVRGEHVYHMPVLAVPARQASLTVQEALRYEAVALFDVRARAADQRFTLTDDKVPAVAEICRHLDGIALAIELAAARVTMLSVAQLSHRLDERFRLLTGGDRTAPARQQTLRATIDWSYGLLNEEERTLLRRLSIFKGGWTLESASVACSDDSLTELAILDILSSLVNKSLVIVDFSEEPRRYRLLESVRAYALERLQEHSESDAAFRRHAQYFSDFGRRVAETFLTMLDTQWLEDIDAELDNIRAALEWSLTKGNDPVLGAELAEHLWPFWIRRHLPEATRWLEMAKAALHSASYPQLSLAIDLALTRTGGRTREDELLAHERNLNAARTLGNKPLLVRALYYYGEFLVFQNRLDEADAILTETLALAQELDDRYRLAATYAELSRLKRKRHLFDDSRNLSDKALRLLEGNPVEHNRALALIDRACLEQQQGDLSKAIALAEEVQKIAQVSKHPGMEMLAENVLALYLAMSRQLDKARLHARAALKLSREEPFQFHTLAAVQVLGSLAAQRGDYDLAARLLGYTQARFPETVNPSNAFIEENREWFRRPLLDHFGESMLANLMAEGAEWPEDKAVEEALRI